MQTDSTHTVIIGRGRSGTVFLDTDARGARVAHKVFSGDGPSRCVLYVFTGAPNPYGWCEHAVRVAACRREILRRLVQFWFGGRVAVPRTVGYAWNANEQAFELAAEFVDGTHLPLRFSDAAGDDPLDELTATVQRPLVQFLIESGFDGAVWQAGMGNPVAANNFLRTCDADGQIRWTWIDLESGVPALFPLNPVPLVRFYLPRSVRHGRPLFDDVDVPKLRAYLAQQHDAIEREQGEEALCEIQRWVDELDRHQAAWKSLGRTQRSLASFVAQGRISQVDAEWYAAHPWRWQARLLVRGVCWAGGEVVDRAGRAWRWLRSVDWRSVRSRVGRFVASQRYREHVARGYVTGRVAEWVERKFFSQAYARSLRSEMRRDDSPARVADFGVHLAIKPAVKFIAWLVLPLLYLAGLMREPALFSAIFASGAVCRTAYTSVRLVQSALRGRRLPWVAFGVGLLPVLGNAAFPLELWYSAVRERRRLAQFLVYDTFARLGRSVPIWGGAGSLVEGWFNRVPTKVIRWFSVRWCARHDRNADSAAAVHSSAAIPRT